MADELASLLRAAGDRLRGARSVCASTGAGMSAESGLATFRDRDGIWSRFNPAELATPAAFERDPLRVWEWYRLRRDNLRRVEPHDGHRVLAAWERRFDRFDVVTQNVDGLHHRAGSTRVIELHGRLDSVRCTACDHRAQTLDDLGADPRCPRCSSRMRPGVVWFGENLPSDALRAAIEAIETCDALLVIGTSGIVQPAASLADAARARGAYVIEINPNRTPISPLADVCLRSGCRDALVALDAALA